MNDTAMSRPRVPPSGRLTVLVLGYIVRGPVGGLAWHHLQYVMGLASLGHDVHFVEDSDDYPSCCDPSRDVMGVDPSYGLQFAGRCFDRVGLGDHWAYHDAHAGHWHGPGAARVLEVCRRADLVLNLSGVNPLRPWCLDVPARALVDTDPVFTQVRHLQDPVARRRALQHTAFFSFGENFGLPGCGTPDDGLPWRPTRQPVVLDAWPVTPGPARGKFTTVLNWDSYGARVHEGRRYGMKSDSFDPYWDLPRRAGPHFELAIGSEAEPREKLRDKGWALRNPLEVTRDPWTYQDYLQQSRAEFGVAKHGYVATWSGWFSERSAAYLASGRPAVIQDTGFSAWLPAGRGVLAFRTPEEALAAIDSVNGDYEAHCRDARGLAEEYFDARKVLPRLLEQALERAPPGGASFAEGARGSWRRETLRGGGG
jgi:hypothetical protein